MPGRWHSCSRYINTFRISDVRMFKFPHFDSFLVFSFSAFFFIASSPAYAPAILFSFAIWPDRDIQLLKHQEAETSLLSREAH